MSSPESSAVSVASYRPNNCSVNGAPYVPLFFTHPTSQTTNPFGRSKGAQVSLKIRPLSGGTTDPDSVVSTEGAGTVTGLSSC